MTDNEKLNKIKDIIIKSNLTGGKITVETALQEMENVAYIEVANLIVEMGSLIADIRNILEGE